MSCRVMSVPARKTARVVPPRVTACSAPAPNHTSFPSADHANPSMEFQPFDKTDLWPFKSSKAIAPPSSGKTSWSTKAIVSPSFENRISLIHPLVSYRTVPIGHSRRYRTCELRTTASSFPFGDQSASVMPSANSLGAPPERGATAKVPICWR